MINKPKSYTVDEVCNSTWLGFDISFKTNKATNILLEELSKILVSDVIITTDTNKIPNTHNLLCIEYKSTFSRYVLKIKYINYITVKMRLVSLVEYLNNICKSDKSSYMRVSMFYDHTTLKTPYKIGNMSKLNYILNFDEKYIHGLIGNFKNPSALNVKNILPIQSVTISNTANMSDNLFDIPIADYYKIDLSNYAYNKITFNYIGGDKWMSIPSNVISVIDYYVIYTYQHLTKLSPTNDDYVRLLDVKHKFSNISSVLNTPSSYLDHQESKLIISVDLSTNVEVLKTMWSRLYKNLFYLQFNNNVDKGYFNYDTESSRYQLKEARISDGILVDYDIIGCEISDCILVNCNIINSRITNSRITNSICSECTKYYGCYMVNNETECGCEIYDTIYINTKDKVFQGNAYNSVIKFCDISNVSQIDNETVVLNKRTLQSMYADVNIDKDMGYLVSII
ncbi:MAG: hypothetical protein ACRDD8_15110 [Bacteroidales bacterium]